MNALRIAARRAPLGAPRTQSRNFVSRTQPRLGGDGHDHHLTFDGKPFSKKLVGIGTFLTVFGGTGIIVFAWQFQNHKHGFNGKAEDEEE